MERLSRSGRFRGNDEIGYLGCVFNDMIVWISNLIEDEYKSELTREKSE
ncbi:hypothetical protein J23TS9_45750 [Paenibacillus sp. J23TS9]|nr:hypothetical protein J23TS9_45750 [Paenibacillus sp. J23TS9]